MRATSARLIVGRLREVSTIGVISALSAAYGTALFGASDILASLSEEQGGSAGLLLGVVAALVGPDRLWRLFLGTGVLGGFTTFSAFGLDAVQLLRRGEWLLATGYAGGSVLLGLAAVWLGLRLAGPA